MTIFPTRKSIIDDLIQTETITRELRIRFGSQLLKEDEIAKKIKLDTPACSTFELPRPAILAWVPEGGDYIPQEEAEPAASRQSDL